MSSAPSCACSTYTSATVECPWVPVGLIMRTLGSWRSSKIGPYRTVLSTGRNQITAQREDQYGERKERSIFCRLRPKTSLSAPPVRRRLIWHTCQHLLADGGDERGSFWTAQMSNHTSPLVQSHATFNIFIPDMTSSILTYLILQS